MLMAETKPLKIANKPMNYHVVLIGVGGTGGYVVRQLIRMMYSYQSIGQGHFHLTLCDGDMVEPKNLLRQDFIEADVNKKKVDVLAHRFTHAYGIPISKRDSYVEDLESLDALCQFPNSFDRYEGKDQLIIVGAVDNNATRQLLHTYFELERDLIYIDAGNDGVILPDRPYEELSVEEREQLDHSGYSGQVVVGLKKDGKLVLPPVCAMYPDMAQDKETFFPSQSCGREVVNNPQRRMTNEVAAMVVTSYLNNLFGQQEIESHMTTFNAQTMKINPRLFTSDYVGYLAEDHGSSLVWSDTPPAETEPDEVDDEDLEYEDEVENEGFEYEDGIDDDDEYIDEFEDEE